MTSSNDNHPPTGAGIKRHFPPGSLDGDRMAQDNPMRPDVTTEVYVRKISVDKFVEGEERSVMIEMESVVSGRNRLEPSILLIEVDLDTVEGWSLDKHVYLLTLVPIR